MTKTTRKTIAARAAAKPIKPTGKPAKAFPQTWREVAVEAGTVTAEHATHNVMCACADCRKSVIVSADNPGPTPLCRCGDTLGRGDGTSLVPGHRCQPWGRVDLRGDA